MKKLRALLRAAFPPAFARTFKLSSCRPLSLFIVLCGMNATSMAASMAEAEFDSISLQRTACFGTCPSYSVEVKADGTVTFVGRKFVSVTGKRTARIEQKEIQFLSLAIQRMEFAKLASSYADRNDGCKEVWTDNPSLELKLVVKGTAKTVTYYLGCRGLPVLDRLSWLAATIDDVAQTEKWIGWKPVQ